jgi:hypothetical protein
VTLLSLVVPDPEFWAGERFGASDLGWPVHYAYLGATMFSFLPGLGLALVRG